MQLKAGVGMGEGRNVVDVDRMNVGEGVGVTAGVSRTRSVGSTSECTHSIYDDENCSNSIACYY